MSKHVLLPTQTFVKPAPVAWAERRDAFRAILPQSLPGGISSEEVQAHFGGMPPHYWETVNEDGLLWGIETIHRFLELVAEPDTPPTKPLMEARQLSGTGQASVMLCTWDRLGLLAKAAAAFSAAGLNILHADAYTRSDNIVLDVFTITGPSNVGAISRDRLQEVCFLLEGALSESPRFASLWMCSRHKYLAVPNPFPARIVIDNHASSANTLVHVEASDRLGLLYDILQSIADNGLDIIEARIETENLVAHDTFYVRDANGGKLLDAARVEKLRLNLETSLTPNTLAEGQPVEQSAWT